MAGVKKFNVAGKQDGEGSVVRAHTNGLSCSNQRNSFNGGCKT